MCWGYVWPTEAAVLIPRFRTRHKPKVKQFISKGVVRIDIPFTFLIECYVDVFAAVFFVYGKTPFELHLNEIIAVNMTGNKICTLPIIVEPHAIKAVVS